MIYPFALPDGPIHSFQALPHPLPECVQQKLKRLSAQCAGLTGENLARYQHQVLSEIAETIDSSRGFAELQRETIRTKCGFVLRAAAKAGLLS